MPQGYFGQGVVLRAIVNGCETARDQGKQESNNAELLGSALSLVDHLCVDQKVGLSPPTKSDNVAVRGGSSSFLNIRVNQFPSDCGSVRVRFVTRWLPVIEGLGGGVAGLDQGFIQRVALLTERRVLRLHVDKREGLLGVERC